MAERAFRELISFSNLLASCRLAANGKRATPPVAQFEYRLGERLRELQRELWCGRWRPGPYVNFTIHEPKRRLISAAPFADRVVHHALVRVIEPRFDRLFIADSFANRTGKGTHRAVDRLQQFTRRHRHVLRLDVRRHFPSIDHAILLRLLERHVHEPRLRELLSLIVASGSGIHDADADPEPFDGDDLLGAARPRGLPIGNLTSQFWSNCYLDPLDRFVTRTLGCRAYLRYVDDLALFGDDAGRLGDWGDRIRGFLAARLRLHLHEESAQVQRCAAGVPWLGFVVFPTHRRVKARGVVAATRRLRAAHALWRGGEISFAEFDARVQGWINHVRYADSWGLREHVLARLPLGGTAVGGLPAAA